MTERRVMMTSTDESTSVLLSKKSELGRVMTVTRLRLSPSRLKLEAAASTVEA